MQAVIIQGKNNSQASCLPGFSFCDEEDLTLTSVITYSVDPFAIDDTPTQVNGGKWVGGGCFNHAGVILRLLGLIARGSVELPFCLARCINTCS